MYKRGTIYLLIFNLIIMKYSAVQFEILLQVLKQFAVHFDLTSVHPCTLHYMAFQQLSEGQKHNSLYCVNGTIKKQHQLTPLEHETATKFIDLDFDFKLYPSGCNDNHIETAVKKAIKQLDK